MAKQAAPLPDSSQEELSPPELEDASEVAKTSAELLGTGLSPVRAAV